MRATRASSLSVKQVVGLLVSKEVAVRMNAHVAGSSRSFRSNFTGQDVLACEKGATMLETAVSFLPFFILCYGLVYFISWAHTTMSMQFALNEAARWAITGKTLVDPITGAQLDRVQSVRRQFDLGMQRFGQTETDATLRMCPISKPNCTSDSVSSPGRHFILVATKPTQQFLGLGGLQPTASVVIRNEPF